MSFPIKVHYDNYSGFRQPYLWVWYYEQGYRQDDFAPTGQDEFGLVYDISVKLPTFGFKPAPASASRSARRSSSATGGASGCTPLPGREARSTLRCRRCGERRLHDGARAAGAHPARRRQPR